MIYLNNFINANKLKKKINDSAELLSTEKYFFCTKISSYTTAHYQAKKN